MPSGHRARVGQTPLSASDLASRQHGAGRGASGQPHGVWSVVEAASGGTYLFVLGWLLYLHARIVVHPFQGEYREGAMLNTTRALLAGRNPFALENGPQDFNQYGVLYNVLTVPLALVFGPSLWVHRTMSAVFVVLLLTTLTWASRRRGCGWPASLGLTALLYVSVFTSSANFGLLARPDSLGLWLMLLSVVVPWHRGFGSRSLAVSGGLAVLACLTKTYFVVGFPLVCAYVFLLVSRRRAVKAALLFAGLGTVSVVAMDLLFPIHSSAVLFSTINFAAGPGYGGGAYAARQLTQFAIWYAPAGAVALVWAVARVRDHARPPPLRTPPGPDGASRDLPVDLFLFAFIGASALIYVSLGRSRGTHMAYLVHLMLPFLLLYVANPLARAGPGARRLCQLLILANVLLLVGRHALPADLDASRSEWGRLATIVDSSERLLNSPVLVSLLVERQRIVYDSGHTQYFRLGAARPGPLAWLLAEDARISKRAREYRAELARAVEARAFDAVVVTSERAALVRDTLIRSHYLETERLWIHMPIAGQSWSVTVFRPILGATTGPITPASPSGVGAETPRRADRRSSPRAEESASRRWSPDPSGSLGRAVTGAHQPGTASRNCAQPSREVPSAHGVERRRRFSFDRPGLRTV